MPRLSEPAGPTHPWFSGRHPRILAHRGLIDPADPTVADNSFAAFAAAHAAGASYFESDCRLTQDGVPVLFHDPDLRRVTGHPAMVRELDLVQLATVMSTRGGLVTLAQALEAFPRIRFNLDVKTAEAAEPVGRLIARHSERVLLTSFSDRNRRAAVAAAIAAGCDPRPATSAGSGTLVRGLAARPLGRRALRRVFRDVDALQVPVRSGALRIVTPRFVAAAHAVGAEVHVWTVNDSAQMTALLEMGVDGLVTDRCDLALPLVSGR